MTVADITNQYTKNVLHSHTKFPFYNQLNKAIIRLKDVTLVGTFMALPYIHFTHLLAVMKLYRICPVPIPPTFANFLMLNKTPSPKTETTIYYQHMDKSHHTNFAGYLRINQLS